MESRDGARRARRGEARRAGHRALAAGRSGLKPARNTLPIRASMSESVPVILASVPFAPLGSPSLGLGLLQACLRERHIESRVWHFGLDFAVEVGVSEYRLVTDELLFTPDLTGDWIFADT